MANRIQTEGRRGVFVLFTCLFFSSHVAFIPFGPMDGFLLTLLLKQFFCSVGKWEDGVVCLCSVELCGFVFSDTYLHAFLSSTSCSISSYESAL